MRRKAMSFALCGCLIALVGLGFTACAKKAKVDDTSARDAEWAAIQKQHDDLEQKRAAARRRDRPPPRPRPKGRRRRGRRPRRRRMPPLPPPRRRPLPPSRRSTTLTQGFNERLVAFINANPPVVGEPPTEQQRAAIRMKSDEDMLVASEYIEKGGDYRRAIKIYQDILMADPDNEALKAALASAEDMRFMTKERFATAKKGMTEDEVRAVLGPANLRNVRHFDKENVTAWYYPKDERGAAAAVWFRPEKKGLRVYQTQFDAIREQRRGAGRGFVVEREPAAASTGLDFAPRRGRN